MGIGLLIVLTGKNIKARLKNVVIIFWVILYIFVL